MRISIALDTFAPVMIDRTANKKPYALLPAVPLKIFAGGKLKGIKPKIPNASKPGIMARVVLPNRTLINIIVSAAIKVVPSPRASMPHTQLSALIIRIIQKIVIRSAGKTKL